MRGEASIFVRARSALQSECGRLLIPSFRLTARAMSWTITGVKSVQDDPPAWAMSGASCV